MTAQPIHDNPEQKYEVTPLNESYNAIRVR